MEKCSDNGHLYECAITQPLTSIMCASASGFGDCSQARTNHSFVESRDGQVPPIRALFFNEGKGIHCTKRDEYVVNKQDVVEYTKTIRKYCSVWGMRDR